MLFFFSVLLETQGVQKDGRYTVAVVPVRFYRWYRILHRMTHMRVILCGDFMWRFYVVILLQSTLQLKLTYCLPISIKHFFLKQLRKIEKKGTTSIVSRLSARLSVRPFVRPSVSK